MIAGLVVLPAIGVTGYHLIEGWNLLDSVYMTVLTLSTVGFSEVHPLSPAGRVFTMCLIVGGGIFAAYALSTIANLFFSGEWRERWENKRRTHMLNQLKEHVIVCGYGRVGRNVVEELKAEGIPCVVLDLSPEKVTAARMDGALALLGDAANDARLREAGIDKARGLVAAAKSDAENVFVVLTARSLRPDLSIVARADLEESEPKLLRAGANRVIMPYHITGRRLVTMLVRPHVADFLDEVTHASGLELLLEQAQVSARSPLAGKSLADVQLNHRLDLTFLACKQADGRWNTKPNGATAVESGCQLIALGTQEQLQRLIDLANA